jgi:hypothetical protein
MKTTTKACTKCGEHKEEREYYFGRVDCIKCNNAYHRAYYQRNREKRIKQIAEYDKQTNRKSK